MDEFVQMDAYTASFHSTDNTSVYNITGQDSFICTRTHYALTGVTRRYYCLYSRMDEQTGCMCESCAKLKRKIYQSMHGAIDTFVIPELQYIMFEYMFHNVQRSLTIPTRKHTQHALTKPNPRKRKRNL